MTSQPAVRRGPIRSRAQPTGNCMSVKDMNQSAEDVARSPAVRPSSAISTGDMTARAGAVELAEHIGRHQKADPHQHVALLETRAHPAPRLGGLQVASGGIIGRSERIRTSDPLLPKQVRYQAALRSDRWAGGYRFARLFARGSGAVRFDGRTCHGRDVAAVRSRLVNANGPANPPCPGELASIRFQTGALRPAIRARRRVPR